MEHVPTVPGAHAPWAQRGKGLGEQSLHGFSQRCPLEKMGIYWALLLALAFYTQSLLILSLTLPCGNS